MIYIKKTARKMMELPWYKSIKFWYYNNKCKKNKNNKQIKQQKKTQNKPTKNMAVL